MAVTAKGAAMTWERATVGRRWLALLAAGVLAVAAGSAEAGRPLDTEDTATVEAGKVELMLSANLAKGPDDPKSLWMTGIFAFGLSPSADARIEVKLLNYDPGPGGSETGIGDTIVAAKFRLVDEARGMPAILVSPILRLPTGDADKGLGADDVDLTLLGVVSKTIGDLTLTGNLGWTAVTRDRGLDFVTLRGSAEVKASKQLTLVGELVADLGMDAAADVTIARAGFNYALSDRMKVDLAVGAGLSSAAPDYTITTGIWVALP